MAITLEQANYFRYPFDANVTENVQASDQNIGDFSYVINKSASTHRGEGITTNGTFTRSNRIIVASCDWQFGLTQLIFGYQDNFQGSVVNGNQINLTSGGDIYGQTYQSSSLTENTLLASGVITSSDRCRTITVALILNTNGVTYKYRFGTSGAWTTAGTTSLGGTSNLYLKVSAPFSAGLILEMYGWAIADGGGSATDAQLDLVAANIAPLTGGGGVFIVPESNFTVAKDAAKTLTFQILDSDGAAVTGVAFGDVTARLSKNGTGAAFSVTGSNWDEPNSDGTYTLDLASGDTDTAGDLFLTLAVTGALDTRLRGHVTAIEADLAVVDGIVDTINTATGTTIPGTITTLTGKVDVVDGIVDTITADVTQIKETDLPAVKTLVEDVPTNAEFATAISGVATAAAVAAAQTDLDTITDTTLPNIASDAAAAKTAAEAANTSVGAGLSTKVDGILEDTGTTLDGKINTLTADLTTVDGIVDAILVGTDSAIPATLATLATAAALASVATHAANASAEAKNRQTLTAAGVKTVYEDDGTTPRWTNQLKTVDGDNLAAAGGSYGERGAPA